MRQMFRKLSNIPYQRGVLFVTVLVTVLLYLPSVKAPFLGDDFIYVVRNSTLQNMTLRDSWKLLFTMTNDYEFLPVRDLSYLFDFYLSGLNPAGFHVQNILIYAVSCIVVWFLSRSLFFHFAGDTHSRPGVTFASIVTLLFAVHPAHVESVAWISGRKDLLSGFFALLALWRFSTALERKSGIWLRLPAAYLFFMLALLSKSTVVSLPVVAFMIGYIRFSEKPLDFKGAWRTVITVWPFFVISVASVLLHTEVGRRTAVLAESEKLMNTGQSGVSGLSVRILGMLTDIAVFPVRLRLIYDVEVPGWRGHVAFACGLLVIVLSLVFVYRLCRKRSLTAFGGVTFVVFCLPFLQLIKFNTWSFASERFLYMPVLGLAVLAASILSRRRSAVIVALPLLAVSGAYLTFSRAAAWQDPAGMSRSNAEYSPGNFYAVANYVNFMLLKNRPDDLYGAVAQVRDTGKREYLLMLIKVHKAVAGGSDAERRSVLTALKNSWAEYESYQEGMFLSKCGELFELCGDYLQAARCYYLAGQDKAKDIPSSSLDAVVRRYEPILSGLRSRTEASPGDAAARMELAGLYLELFQFDAAEQQYRRLLKDFALPEVVRIVHYNLGLTLMKKKDYVQARAEIEEAVKGGFNSADAWNNLGIVYRKLGRFDESEKCFRTAMDIDTRHKHSAFNLATLQQVRNRRAEAVETFREAKRRYQAAGVSAAAIDEQLMLLGERR